MSVASSNRKKQKKKKKTRLGELWLVIPVGCRLVGFFEGFLWGKGGLQLSDSVCTRSTER